MKSRDFVWLLVVIGAVALLLLGLERGKKQPVGRQGEVTPGAATPSTPRSRFGKAFDRQSPAPAKGSGCARTVEPRRSRPVASSTETLELDLDHNFSKASSHADRFRLLTLSGHRALVKIDLSPPYCGALFRVHYRGAPRHWSVDIGDSATDDGWGGDGATQTNDAEVQVLGSTLGVYGSDLLGNSLGPNVRLMKLVRGFVRSNQTVEFEVRDHYTAWTSPTRHGQLQSPALFALSGEPDREGPVNYDIYAAFNRVVDGDWRDGSGVSRVEIRLLRR